MGLCAKSTSVRNKINIHEYGFNAEKKDIPPNYFCVVDKQVMDYAGLYVNDTSNLDIFL